MRASIHFAISPSALSLLVRIAVVVTWVTVLGGCTGLSPTPRETINAVVIRNETADPILDVALKVPKSHMIVGTNQILPLREYALKFSASKNKRESATLSWIQRGRAYTRDIRTYIPDDLEERAITRVVITVSDHGQLSSRVEPWPPE